MKDLREILLDMGFKDKSSYYTETGISDYMCIQIGYTPKEIYELSINYGKGIMDKESFDFIVTVDNNIITLITTECYFDCCGNVKYRGEFNLEVIKDEILNSRNWDTTENMEEKDLEKLKTIKEYILK